MQDEPHPGFLFYESPVSVLYQPLVRAGVCI